VANITVSVPDEVYNAARIKAAKQRTSVSALVREYLIGMASQTSEFQRLLALQEEVLDQIQLRGGGFAASERMTRDEVHDRNALR
jgi:plasmid stability protein